MRAPEAAKKEELQSSKQKYIREHLSTASAAARADLLPLLA
jgi:hypothetical protein